MLDSELAKKQSYLDHKYGGQRQKATLAYILLVSGILIFILTLSGIFNGVSNSIEYFLLDELGYTSKWTKTFGPKGFADFMNQIAALSSKFFILVCIILITLYFRIRGEHKQVWKFLFVILGGISFLIFVKLLFAEEPPDDPILMIVTNIGSFPSGHAYMSVIFYLTFAVLLSRKQEVREIRKLIFISASSLIFIIGISRILGASHNLNEVIAGWALGLVWVSFCWLMDYYIRMNFRSKLR